MFDSSRKTLVGFDFGICFCKFVKLFFGFCFVLSCAGYSAMYRNGACNAWSKCEWRPDIAGQAAWACRDLIFWLGHQLSATSHEPAELILAAQCSEGPKVGRNIIGVYERPRRGRARKAPRGSGVSLRAVLICTYWIQLFLRCPPYVRGPNCFSSIETTFRRSSFREEWYVIWYSTISDFVIRLCKGWFS